MKTQWWKCFRTDILYNHVVNNNWPCLAASITKVILSSMGHFSEASVEGLAARKHRMDSILPFMTRSLKLPTITQHPNSTDWNVKVNNANSTTQNTIILDNSHQKQIKARHCRQISKQYMYHDITVLVTWFATHQHGFHHAMLLQSTVHATTVLSVTCPRCVTHSKN